MSAQRCVCLLEIRGSWTDVPVGRLALFSPSGFSADRSCRKCHGTGWAIEVKHEGADELDYYYCEVCEDHHIFTDTCPKVESPIHVTFNLTDKGSIDDYWYCETCEEHHLLTDTCPKITPAIKPSQTENKLFTTPRWLINEFRRLMGVPRYMIQDQQIPKKSDLTRTLPVEIRKFVEHEVRLSRMSWYQRDVLIGWAERLEKTRIDEI